MSRSTRSMALASALFLSATVAVPSLTLAQSQSINGTIRGRAADPSGAGIGGATVTATNPAANSI